MGEAPGFVSYLRVSTARQGRSGLGLDAQKKCVAEFVESRGGSLIAPDYIEVESGKRDARPELQKALRQCQVTGATLVVAKLDRLSRNAAFLMTLRDSAIQFVAVDLPEANTNTVGVMAVVAQYEREAIGTRTRIALEAAKRRGKILGGSRRGAANIATYQKLGVKASQDKARASAELRREAVELALIGSKTLEEVSKSLNLQNVRTSRGCSWTPTSVSRLLNRLQLRVRVGKQ